MWTAGKRIRLGGPLQQRVLVTLLLEVNHVVPLTRLIAAGWDEDPPATAGHQVRKVVADLRRRLPGGSGLIITDGPGYRIVLDDDQLDLSLFGIRIGRARTAAANSLVEDAVAELRSALELWRGQVMGGAGSAVVVAVAQSLEERRLAAGEQLIELRISLGEGPELIGDLRSLVQEYPLRESLRGHLMLALYRSGRQAEALEEYMRVRVLLAEELGIDPGPALDRMYAAILCANPDLEPVPPVIDQQKPTILVTVSPLCTLPYDLPDFTGRAVEVETILSQVGNSPGEGMRIVVLDGMAGSGKTALAIHAAHLLKEQYSDGQLYFDLNGFTPGQEPVKPYTALNTLLRTLGVPADHIPDEELSRAALWRGVTAQQRLLILLDNAFDEAQIRPLLPGTSSCLVLITSRSRFANLDGMIPLSIAMMTHDDSFALFSRTIRSDRLNAEPDAVDCMIRLCGHLPLAMRICAARLDRRPQWTIRYLVERLRDETTVLDELSSQNRSVAATIRLSHEAMDSRHRAVFVLLGQHPSTDIDSYAAAALTGMSVAEVEPVLEHLLDMHLLEQYESGRYVFHDLVHRFARGAESTLSSGELAGAGDRLLDYYAACVARAAELIQPGRLRVDVRMVGRPRQLPEIAAPEAALTWFNRELHNLLATISLAVARGSDGHAFCLSRDLAYYCGLMGYTDEALETAHIAVNAARNMQDRGLEGLALMNLAIPYWNMGQIRQALDRSLQALEITAELGDAAAYAACLSRVGSFRNSLGEYTEGLHCHGLALAAHRAAGDRHEEASTLLSISSAQEALGQYEQAIESALLCVQINAELGIRPAQIMGLINLTNARLGLGEHEAAFADLEWALELSRQVGTPGIKASVLACYADAYRWIGRIDEAYDHGLRALNAVWARSSPARGAKVENILGAIHRDRGEHSQSLERHRLAHRLAEQAGFRIEIARALEGIGQALHAQGETRLGDEHLQRALVHYQEMGIQRVTEMRESNAGCAGRLDGNS